MVGPPSVAVDHLASAAVQRHRRAGGAELRRKGDVTRGEIDRRSEPGR